MNLVMCVFFIFINADNIRKIIAKKYQITLKIDMYNYISLGSKLSREIYQVVSKMDIMVYPYIRVNIVW